MNCLYLAQELAPYFMEGGLGQTARALPAALERDHAITHDLVVPYYPWLVARHGLETECVWATPALTVGSVTGPARIERLLGRPGPGEVFLVRADHWYDRGGIYRDQRYVEFPDAAQRAAFFGACVGAWLAASGRRYDIVHGNDWQSGPALAHLRALRGTATSPALLVNVHSAEYTGEVPPDTVGSLALPAGWDDVLHNAAAQCGERPGLLLLALLAADAATTGSPAYAGELLARTAGTAIGAALSALPLSGIIAGIDTVLWQPAAPGRPTAAYGRDTVRSGKAANKRLLQQRLGLKEDPAVALFGVCSRLVHEKGVDLLIEAATPLVRDGRAQLAVVGQGDEALVARLTSLARDAPTAVAHVPAFDQESAWLTYAGSDFTVMPSRVEPCGLNQLIAMTYGTVPVVSAVGGLTDTVTDLTASDGTGFVIPELTAGAVQGAMLRALRWLAGPADDVDAVRRRVMALDWSWARSARDTAALYRRTTNH
ncbi:glycogen/starch synthase (plasmid) [Streptomyces sp. NBC_00868]|uniref:glycogen synthase n=1 Tax=Streptomyces sp. NBC_00868 TaxID=2903683 RepID=UPI002F91A7F3|nr:glycogen/starch synthase [Streptomyces sp. NBC_00868]